MGMMALAVAHNTDLGRGTILDLGSAGLGGQAQPRGSSSVSFRSCLIHSARLPSASCEPSPSFCSTTSKA
eukprot:6166661-Pyramimonas_sp.AAC.1